MISIFCKNCTIYFRKTYLSLKLLENYHVKTEPSYSRLFVAITCCSLLLQTKRFGVKMRSGNRFRPSEMNRFDFNDFFMALMKAAPLRETREALLVVWYLGWWVKEMLLFSLLCFIWWKQTGSLDDLVLKVSYTSCVCTWKTCRCCTDLHGFALSHVCIHRRLSVQTWSTPVSFVVLKTMSSPHMERR